MEERTERVRFNELKPGDEFRRRKGCVKMMRVSLNMGWDCIPLEGKEKGELMFFARWWARVSRIVSA